MKTLKKVLAIFLCISISLCIFAGCNGKGGNTTSETSSKATGAFEVLGIFSSGVKGTSSTTDSSVVSSTTVQKVELKPNATINKGRNFTFSGSISLEVLSNYLDRAITYGIYSEGDSTSGRLDTVMAEDAKRAILNVGAKLIARTIACWMPSITEESGYPQIEKWIEDMHKVDPEIIFEACIFETAPDSINTISIPKWVFEAFGEKYKKRTFNVEKMLSVGGDGRNYWGENFHAPDITRLETQMWYYYRACTYIDMGFESLHLGQTHLVGRNDPNRESWTKIIKMIRDYAKKNARRKYVIINGHYPSQNFVGTDGVMLADYNAFPLRIDVTPGEKNHAVREDYPQRCSIVLISDAAPLYSGAIKGTSPSGWTTDKYPYLVEFDNWSGKTGDNTIAQNIWGYDEISWFANQPQWYRFQFMSDVTRQVREMANNGHVALPGRRTTYISKLQKQDYYVMNNSEYYKNGFSDEQGIIGAWK